MDGGVCLLFVLLAGWLTHGLWPDPATRTLALNPTDQVLYEWFIAYDARILLGDFGLVTDRLNSPDGVNLLANTSVIALGAVLAPVTLAFGAPVSFAVLVAGNLAGTAIAWYLFYGRVLRVRRIPAITGAALCGFAPAMMSQSNSHLHMTAQWLVPPIVWCVLRMAHRPVAFAPGLAALVTVQVFVGEEVLLLTALTLALVTGCWAVCRPAAAWRLLPRFVLGMLAATGLATAALAYPLWMQFAGPQHVPNGAFSPAYFSVDPASFSAFSPLSLAGTGPAEPARLTTGPAEYNTFLGWPLLVTAAGALAVLRRRPVAWAIAVAAAVMTWLSLGPEHGLYRLLEPLPVVGFALPMRFAMALVPLIATLLVLAIDEVWRTPRTRATASLAAAAALLPVAPEPLPVADRVPVPAFVTQGHWRECVEPGGVLVPAPLPTPTKPDAMRWAAAANAAFGIPEGFFIGPYAAGGRASVGVYSQPTSQLLAEVAETGQVPPIDAAARAAFRADMRHWRASCVALADGPHAAELRAALNALAGPGKLVAGTWTWSVK